MSKPLPNGRSANRYAGPVIVMSKAVFDTPEYRALSHRARSLLTMVHLTYRGRDNGSLRILFARPEQYGFASRQQMQLARDELLCCGWIEITRQGGRHIPTLYCLTWLPVDANDAEGIKAAPPLGLWRASRSGDRDTHGKTMPRASGRRRSENENLVPRYGKQPPSIVPRYGKQTGAISPPHGTVGAENDLSCFPYRGKVTCIAMGPAEEAPPSSERQYDGGPADRPR